MHRLNPGSITGVFGHLRSLGYLFRTIGSLMVIQHAIIAYFVLILINVKIYLSEIQSPIVRVGLLSVPPVITQEVDIALQKSESLL